MTTREKIIDAALTLFAQKGYGDVYVGEIADAVGIKAPSLYKHFKNKKDIFEALLKESSIRYSQGAVSLGINGSDAGSDAGIYKDISEDSLIEIGKGLFLYFLHDSYMSRLRKVLTLEQFKDPTLASMYTGSFYEGPVRYQAEIFKILTGAGKLRSADPEIMAVEFYCPIYTLLTVCDRDPSFEKQAIKLIEEHIREFNRNYKKE